MRAWKSPEIERLRKIEKWAEQRDERRLQGRDIAGQIRAAIFYEMISRRGFLEAVSRFR